MLPLIVRRQLHAQLAGAVERRRPDDVRLLATHVRAAGAQSMMPMPWRCSPRRPRPTSPAWPARRPARTPAPPWFWPAPGPQRRSRRAGRRVRRGLRASRPGRGRLLRLGSGRQHDGPPGEARRLTRGAVVAWDLGRFADANQLLDAADRALAGVTACAENVEVEEVRVRFAARSTTSQVSTRASPGWRRWGERPAPAGPARRWCTPRFKGPPPVATATGYASPTSSWHSPATRNRCSSARPAAVVGYLPVLGDLTAARASAEEGIRLARQSGVPALEILHDVLLAIVEVVAGDWAAALRRTFR